MAILNATLTITCGNQEEFDGLKTKVTQPEYETVFHLDSEDAETLTLVISITGYSLLGNQ